MNRLLVIPLCAFLVAFSRIFLPGNAGIVYGIAIGAALPLAATVSSFMTARRFAPDEPMRRCWLWFGAGYSGNVAIVIVNAYVRATGKPQMALSVAILIITNVSQAVALYLFVRAWRATGLPTESNSKKHFAITAFAVIAVLAIGGYPVVHSLSSATTDAFLLIGTLGDVVAIIFVIPLAMPAYALRGGSLMYVWMYLTASTTGWLVYDTWAAFRPLMALSVPLGRNIQFGLAMLAVGFAFTATLAQRKALQIPA